MDELKVISKVREWSEKLRPHARVRVLRYCLEKAEYEAEMFPNGDPKPNGRGLQALDDDKDRQLQVPEA